MATISKCLVCGSEHFADYLTVTDFMVSGEEFNIVRCNDCGFIFTANPPDEREMGQYYLSEDYISHTDTKRNITEVVYHMVRHLMLGRKQTLISRLCHGNKGSLLDIGSGTGYFAAYMKTKGWEVKGIEISERARNFSSSKFGIDVLPPEKVKTLNEKSFDCITLWHVIEHFNDPGFWLNEMSRILKDNGICILAMPNIDSSDSKWFGKNWAALDVPRHLWHFAPDTFNKLINRFGFKSTMIKGMPLDLFYISILSYKNQKKRFAFLNGLLTGIMITIKNIIRGRSASSLIYVIEKTDT